MQASISNPSQRSQMDEFQRQKYILFELENEDYCMPIMQTREVLVKHHITRFPNLADCFQGAISLRGEPVPVWDLRRKFGLPQREGTANSRIIIVETSSGVMGIEVDSVRRVMGISEAEMTDAPSFSGSYDAAGICGVVEIKPGRFAIVLDMEAVLADVSMVSLAELKAGHGQPAIMADGLASLMADTENEKMMQEGEARL